MNTRRIRKPSKLLAPAKARMMLSPPLGGRYSRQEGPARQRQHSSKTH